MNIFLTVLLNFVPLLLILICLKVFVHEFKFLHGLLVSFLGLLAVFPITFIQAIVIKLQWIPNTSLSAILLNDLLINGLIEETFKMLVLFLLPSKKMSLSQFFLYSLIAGFSLACFENSIYLLEASKLFELRIISSLVIHFTCSALSGLFVYSVKKRVFKISPFLMAVILHGIYNYFAGFKTNTVFFYFSFVVILVSLVQCRTKYNLLREKIEEKNI
jgi:RsiW-degrading membrane proteinase PrsW (M82 family)